MYKYFTAKNTLTYIDVLPKLVKSCNNTFKIVYTTQVNSTFRARWLASSKVISQVLFTSEQPRKNKMAFVGILSQIKLLFGLLVIQLVWYILKQLFTSVCIFTSLRWIIVNYFILHRHFHSNRIDLRQQHSHRLIFFGTAIWLPRLHVKTICASIAMIW